MVNAELVRRGYAQVMTVPPNVRYQDLFLKLQREARDARRGLWQRLPIRPICFVGALGWASRTASTLERYLRAPPRSWTFLGSLPQQRLIRSA